jgi:hypothetical protein
MEYVALIKSALDLANGIMQRSPKFNEREKKKFAKEKGEFLEELNKPLDERDHELIMNLSDALAIEMERIRELA